LQAGDLYFNTVDDAIKVYTGSAWVAAYITAAGFVTVADAQTITGVKTFDNGLATDTISEETSAAGVTIDGVLLKDSEVTTDVINEKTSATGVTIDGVLLKDTTVTANTIKASGTSSTQGEVQLFEDTDNGTNYVAIKAPASIASNITLTLPDADGSAGQALVTNGSGVLSFADAGGGKVLQVVQTVKTDTFSTTSTSKVDITGMSVSITPTSATSKILIIATVNYGGTDYNYYCDLLRGATVLNAPASGNNPCTISLCGITNTTYQIFEGTISYLDSPATTSSTTYKLQIACQSTGSFRLNRSERDGANDSVCSSTITAMEIAA
jgi:hypothetical protein